VELLWTDFLNSEWHDWRGSGRSEDRLDKPGWLAEFLAAWHLNSPPPPTDDELDALKALRARLTTVAEQLAGGAVKPAEETMAMLNAVLAPAPVIRSLVNTSEGCRIDLVPVRSDWTAVMAEIAADCARTLTTGEGARIRICENPDCRWVFYDETRNRAKRFCDDKLCGNLMKVRRFRARQKER
jgi:predicted RNA-binding Zn ribbon-like protein